MSTADKRVAISLAPGEREALQQLAHEAGEAMATTAGRLVRSALADHGAMLDAPPARRAGPPRPRGTKQRPVLAEPAAAIDALRARYPHELRHLPADPTTDNYIADQTDALVTVRARLDAAGPDTDPYEVFRFGQELRALANYLQDRARRAR